MREEHWLCPSGISVRLLALGECEAMSRSAADQAAMLYLMGLAYADVPYIADGRDACERHYFHQEGSSVCVYDNAHFDRVVARYPASKWAEMAAFRVAQSEYRYYECEGSVTCAAENGIAGYVDYLDRRPNSPYASLATEHVVEALAKLSDAGAGTHNDASRLPKDLDRLSAIARKLSAANREKLVASIGKARPVVDRIDRQNRAASSK